MILKNIEQSKTGLNQEYQTLLGIPTEDELRRVVLKGWPRIPRGISLTFSLFTEVAGRDRETIDHAWSSIFYSQLPEKKHRFYQDIEAIRTLKKLPVLSGCCWIRDDISRRIYRPEDYADGTWRVALTLPENYAHRMWNFLKSQTMTIILLKLQLRLYTAFQCYILFLANRTHKINKFHINIRITIMLSIINAGLST
ncbi:TPA: hypothetical protein ACOVFI_003868 [Citrobacter braakii]